jgi:3-phenylpropionate/cinnamic acid dioxygenase small subunit
MMTRRCGVVAVAVLTLAFSSSLAFGEDDVVREARDRAEIEALMWRYVRALDTLNADAYVAAYTPDGQFGSGPTAPKGHDALKKMIIDLKQGQVDRAANSGARTAPMYHVITNPYVEFVDKDHVRYRAYWMTVFGAAGENAPPRVAAAGREYDELVRVNGRWLIKLRDVAPKDER